VISDTLAVFVAAAPAGSDSNAGTKEHPVATLGKGVQLAESGGTKRVIACGATYAESLSLSAPGDDVGLQVFGGVACPSDPAPWTYTGTKAIVLSSGAGPALRVSGLTKPVLFQDVELEAASMDGGAPPGSSSFGAVVTGTASATFTNVTFVAKDATSGADGTTPKSNHATESLNGANAGADGGTAAGAATTCPCPDGTSSTGGQGGVGATSPGPGLPDAGGGTAGENGQQCTGANALGGGSPGSDALPQTANGSGASTNGSFGDAGWAPSAGNAGSNGPPGQGGGGGGDGPTALGAGGGGACGGCGGAGGSAGGGGGSSIALLFVQSSVTLTKCQFIAGAAGNGGKGATGEDGQAGGFVPGNPSNGGCQGGGGGAGAGGNGGGGGAGGISAGVAYSGTPPTIDGSPIPSAATLTNVTIPGAGGIPGAKGTGGPAASSLAGKPGNDGTPGAAGVAQAVMVVP
jgi:hypothetical protein